MSEENSTISHLSAAMTTTSTDEMQTMPWNITMSSSSSGADLYIQCAVVVIGVVGAAANALVLYAMVASKQHRKQLLIFNQNVFDLFSCLFMAMTYALKLCNIYLTGTLGYWLCMIIISENLYMIPTIGSAINLMSITIERYLKVVHPSWSHRILRTWVIYSAMAFAWISSFVYNIVVVFSTSAVIDGVCYAYMFWKSRVAAVAHGIWYFVTLIIILLVIFIFCYWRIVVVIRRQAMVMASHSGSGTSAAQTHSEQIQSNVIKTMIFISAFYAITTLPVHVYYLYATVTSNLTLVEAGYYLVVFIAHLYIATNPFIYATKFEPVKQVLMRMIPCKKSQQVVANG